MTVSDFCKINKKSSAKDNYYYANCDWCSLYSFQRIGQRTRGLGNKRTSGDHPSYSITEIGQNTKKSPGDLRRHGVTQTLVKDHQLRLM